MRIFYLTILTLLILSCNKQNKYSYTEIIKGSSNDVTTITEKPSTIYSKNDTLAFIEAYKKFKISQKTMKELKHGGSLSPKEVVSFKLINSKGKDISNIDFKTKKSEQEKANEHVSKIKMSYKINK